MKFIEERADWDWSGDQDARGLNKLIGTGVTLHIPPIG